MLCTSVVYNVCYVTIKSSLDMEGRRGDNSVVDKDYISIFFISIVGTIFSCDFN